MNCDARGGERAAGSRLARLGDRRSRSAGGPCSSCLVLMLSVDVDCRREKMASTSCTEAVCREEHSERPRPESSDDRAETGDRDERAECALQLRPLRKLLTNWPSQPWSSGHSWNSDSTRRDLAKTVESRSRGRRSRGAEDHLGWPRKERAERLRGEDRGEDRLAPWTPVYLDVS